MTDEFYIQRTLELARQGIRKVNPNPMVGSVIVKNGEIIGEGYHHCFGKAHAEIEALRDAGENTKGATLYVNLEPCCHHGKTPPCTDAIIKAGIKKVVIGMVDPNPLVNKGGIEVLKSNNIEVVSGIEEEKCKKLNRVFIKYITQKLPYITLKIAQSLDGRIATKTGNSQWITSDEARAEAHRLRSENDAIIVGIGTILADNPRLNVRHVEGLNPVRIILDSNLRIPLESTVLNDEFISQTIVVTNSTDNSKISQIKEKGAHLWQMDHSEDGRISIPDLMQRIAQARFSAIMVEGGSQVFTSFLKSRMVDRLVFAIAPKIIGEGINSIGDLEILKVDDCLTFQNTEISKIGPDIFVSAEILPNLPPGK